jgi:hypothetical protein
VGDVDDAGTFEDGLRDPEHFSFVRHDGECVTVFTEPIVSTVGVKANNSYLRYIILLLLIIYIRQSY